MHPELEDLFTRTVKLAKRKLRADGEIPVFASVLDSAGEPRLLQPEFEEGAPEIRLSVAGMVELWREMIRQSETSGATVCAPMILPTDTGEKYDGLEIHGDHAFDPHAFRMVVRYAKDERGEFVFDVPIWQDTDDLLVARAT